MTLIETLLYTGLFMMLMTGGIMTGYRLIDSASSLSKHADLQSEINFVLHTIDYITRDAQDIALPTSSHLVVTNKNGKIQEIITHDDVVTLIDDANMFPLHRPYIHATLLFSLRHTNISPRPLLQTYLTLSHE